MLNVLKTKVDEMGVDKMGVNPGNDSRTVQLAFCNVRILQSEVH